jgi:hypothetical protein
MRDFNNIIWSLLFLNQWLNLRKGYKRTLQVEKEHTKEHIVFLGENGFPKGLAAIQRMTLMAKALLHEKCQVTVVCRKGVWNQDKK